MSLVRYGVKIEASRLPAEYQEVEYLAANGTQYIDTGVKPGNDYGFLVDYELCDVTTKTTANQILGVIDNNNLNYWGLCQANGQLYAYWANTSTQSSQYTTVYTLMGTHLKRMHVELNYNNSKKCIINNHITLNLSSTTWTNTYNVWFFNLNPGLQSYNYSFLGKIFYSEFTYQNTLYRQYIPCYRKSDKKPGFYETKTSTFLTNSGTDEFGIGPDVNYYTPSNQVSIKNSSNSNIQNVEIDAKTYELEDGLLFYAPLQYDCIDRVGGLTPVDYKDAFSGVVSSAYEHSDWYQGEAELGIMCTSHSYIKYDINNDLIKNAKTFYFELTNFTYSGSGQIFSIGKYYNSTFYRRLGFFVNSSYYTNIEATLSNTSTPTTYNYTDSTPRGQFNKIAITITSDKIIYYKNGSKIGEESISDTWSNWGDEGQASIFVGYRPDSTSLYANSGIGNIKVYSKNFTETELADMTAITGIFAQLTSQQPTLYQRRVNICHPITQYTSNANARINTGVIPNSNYKIELEIAFNYQYSPQTIFCCRTTANTNSFTLFYFRNQFRADLGDYQVMVPYYPEYDERLHITFGKGKCIINNTSINLPEKTISPTTPIYLFGSYTYNGSSYSWDNQSSMKLYSCKIWNDNDVLLRDYIPIYTYTDSVNGLYDLVNNTFAYSIGSGGSSNFIFSTI